MQRCAFASAQQAEPPSQPRPRRLRSAPSQLGHNSAHEGSCARILSIFIRLQPNRARDSSAPPREQPSPRRSQAQAAPVRARARKAPLSPCHAHRLLHSSQLAPRCSPAGRTRAQRRALRGRGCRWWGGAELDCARCQRNVLQSPCSLPAPPARFVGAQGVALPAVATRRGVLGVPVRARGCVGRGGRVGGRKRTGGASHRLRRGRRHWAGGTAA